MDTPAGTSPRWSQLTVRMGAAVLIACLTAACSTGGTTGAEGSTDPGRQPFTTTQVEPAGLTAGQAVPLTTEPILRVGGKISSPNDGEFLQLGLDTLDEFEVLEVDVYEPWVKDRQVFQGVWLADVLAAAGAADSASSVQIVALDDFSVDLTMAEVDAGGIFLATKTEDGSPIPLEDGGPTRIVFMEGVAAGASPDQWIWSLKDISVR